MAKNKQKDVKLGKDDQKLFAFLSSFFLIIGFIVAWILWKNDKYVMHYAKQGLVLFIGMVLIVTLGMFLSFIGVILWIFWVILWIVTWVNTFSGKRKKTFLISDLADKIEL